jgi:uncharacterized membrane protein (GlpM family)
VLALKLLLVPFFLAVISLASKRLGVSFAGWLAGLPVVVGPILFLIALENGTAFASRAAVFTLAAVLTVIAFGVGYTWAARNRHWPYALAAALACWLVAAWLVSSISFNLWGAAAAALLSLVIARWVYPTAAIITTRAPLPMSELFLRMAAGAVLTLAVTHFAQSVGTAWSGIAALAPVLTPVLAVFIHRRSGGAHAIALLKALPRGLFSLAAFCFVIAWQLESLGIAIGFLVAICVALSVQGLTFILAARAKK